MPVRNDREVKKSRGIAGAMAADEAVMQQREAAKLKPPEKKVTFGGQVEESKRNFWAGRAKGEGKTVIGLIEEYFEARYGTPDNPK